MKEYLPENVFVLTVSNAKTGDARSLVVTAASLELAVQGVAVKEPNFVFMTGTSLAQIEDMAASLRMVAEGRYTEGVINIT